MEFACLLLGASALLYGQTPESAIVLKEAREKIHATMQHISKYMCVQTVDRSYYAPSKPSHGAPCNPAGEKAPRLTSTDRLRLEVTADEGREIHAWPGAGAFDLREIDQIVDQGPFGTGSFGGYLLDIFGSDATQFDYRGETTRNGRRLMTYAYTVARNTSHYQVRTYSSWTTTAFNGTFEVDAESFEIERLTLETAPLPAETQLCEVESVLDLHRVGIGDGNFLLPRESQLHLTLRNGQEHKSTTTFSRCREYQAHSTVQFHAPPAAATNPIAGTTNGPRPASRRYELDLRLHNTIDTDEAAAGDPVTATVTHDVHDSQSKKVAIPAGAVAHGRISRIEHHMAPYEYVVIGIAFQSIEIHGETWPFTARPQNGGAVLTNPIGSGSTAVERPVAMAPAAPMPQLRTPLGPRDSFVFPFEKHHALPAGTVSRWDTIYPPRTSAK